MSKEGKARFRKYQFIYCKFENDADQSLYKSEPGLGHPFHSTHRIKLLMMMIQGESFRGGADINVGECLELKQEEGFDEIGGYGMLSFFPLHDPTVVNDLYRTWVVWQQWPWKQPIDKLRMYLGEKAGLYFGFLCHYTEWLIYIAIPALLVFAAMFKGGFYNTQVGLPMILYAMNSHIIAP